MKNPIIIFALLLTGVTTAHAQCDVTLTGASYIALSSGSGINVTGDLTIPANAILSIRGNMTVSGTLTNSNGASGIVVESDATGTGSLIESSGVNATVERFITQDIYHYLSPPVSGQAISLLQSGTVHTDYDLFWYDEDYSGGGGPAWIDASGQSGSLEVGLGYAYTYNPSDRTLEFAGTTNQGTITEGVTYSYDAGVSTDEWYFGWNLVGNPYPSRINATTFIDDADNSGIYGTLYFWDEGAGYSNERNDYATWNKTGAVSGGGGQTPNGYIGIAQAFMVHYGSGTGQSSGNISFKQNMRVHDAAEFFKNQNQRFKIGIENEEGDYNETLIGFVPGTSNGFDNKYDGYKLKGNPMLALYTKLVQDDGYDYAIQALPPLNKGVTVKLGLNAGMDGLYTYKVANVKNFHDTTSIFLDDLYENITVNMRTTEEYSFLVDEAGIYNDRFILRFNTSAVGIDESGTIENPFHVFAFNGKVIIENTGLRGDFVVRIYNALGQLMVHDRLMNNSRNEIRLNGSPGIYVVKLTGNKQVYSTRVHHGR